MSPRHEPPDFSTGYAGLSDSDAEATIELVLDSEATGELTPEQLQDLYKHLEAQRAPVSLDFGDGYGDEDPTAHHKLSELLPESFADVGQAENLYFDSDASEETRLRTPRSMDEEETGLADPRGDADPAPPQSAAQRRARGTSSRNTRRWRIQTDPESLAPEEQIPAPALESPASSTQWVMPNSSAPGSMGPASSVGGLDPEDDFEVFSFDPRQAAGARGQQGDPQEVEHDPFLDAPTINYEPLSRSLDLPEDDHNPPSTPGTALGRPALPGSLSRIRTVALDRYQVDERLMILRDPEGAVANKYRMLDFKLRQIAQQRPVRTVAFTAPQPGSGTSLTALNLALIRAESPHVRVALVDLDLRHPSLAASMGVKATPSLMDLLQGEATLDQVLVRLGDTQCYLLPGTEEKDHASRFYKSPELTQIFAQLYDLFDLVVMDLPSVIPRADINLVNPLVDAIVMVVAAGRTQGPSLRQATQMIDHDKLIGVVLNEAPE